MSDIIQLTLAVPDAEVGERLDVYLTGLEDLPMSRAQLKRAILAGEVSINGKIPTKAGVKLRAGDQVICAIAPPAAPNLDPCDIPLEILYEDEDLVLVNKPAGLVVHPAPGHPDGTLVNALVHHAVALSDEGDAREAFRPGIVHRLDKDTSGVMVVCKNNKTHRHLAEQFAAHTIERRYIALCLGGSLPNEGTFDTRHGRDPRNRMKFTGRVPGGRRAITHYKVIERYEAGLALLAVTLETGRTHQIRVHLAEAGAPILADTFYGDARVVTSLLDRQALHADLLGFEHPNGEWLRFRAPLPEDLRRAIATIRAQGDKRA